MVLTSFFVKASALPGDLDFDLLVFRSITRGGCTIVFTSKHAAQLEPRGGTLSSCKGALSEFVLGAHSAPSSHAFITAHTPEELLDWCSAIIMGVTMVGDFSSGTFTHSELLV